MYYRYSSSGENGGSAVPHDDVSVSERETNQINERLPFSFKPAYHLPLIVFTYSVLLTITRNKLGGELGMRLLQLLIQFATRKVIPAYVFPSSLSKQHGCRFVKGQIPCASGYPGIARAAPIPPVPADAPESSSAPRIAFPARAPSNIYTYMHVSSSSTPTRQCSFAFVMFLPKVRTNVCTGKGETLLCFHTEGHENYYVLVEAFKVMSTPFYYDRHGKDTYVSVRTLWRGHVDTV